MDVSDLTTPECFDSVGLAERHIDSYIALVSEFYNFQTLGNGKPHPIQGIPAWMVTINSIDSQSTTKTLKSRPPDTNVMLFTGQDENYLVCKFHYMCEDVIWQLGMTDNMDKITLRSRLVPGSRALKMMQHVVFLT